MLSTLEHHSNIVPWQLIAERTGAEIDVAPLTEDGRIDLDAMAAMLTERHKHRRARPCLERARLGARREARRRARPSGRREAAARRLPGGAAHAGRRRRASAATSTSSPATSSTARPASACSGARAELLEAMPPWQGGGAMIDKVTLRAHHLRAAAGAVRGGHAARRRRDRARMPRSTMSTGIGLDAIAAHEAALVREARDALVVDQQRPPVRAGGQRRHRQLRGRGGASARHRHHIGREPGGDPRRAIIAPSR